MAGQNRWFTNALLAKLETVYGTDAVPTGAANCILKTDVTVTPLTGDVVPRVLDLPYRGSQGTYLVNQRVMIEFSTELAGGGTPLGTPPAWGTLARAAGMAETITAATKVTYNPISGSFESATFYFYISGNLHKATGCRGTWSIQMNQGQIPTIKWTFMGLANAVTAAALPSPLTTTAWKKPLPATKVNTPTFTLGGQVLKVRSSTIDCGNQLEFRGLIGDESVHIGSDGPGVTGNDQFESVDQGTNDWFAATANRTGLVKSVIHGTVAGNIVKIDAPAIEVGGDPSYVKDGSFVNLGLPLNYTTQSGNDEVVLTCV